MAIRLLTADAQHLIAQKHSENSRIVADAQARLRKIRAANPYAPEATFVEIGATVTALKNAIRGLETFLGAHDVWSQSQSEPVQVELVGETARGLFGKRISGHVFLYLNAFYEVFGQYSPTEAKALLVHHVRKKREEVEYVLSKNDDTAPDESFERMPIPEEVRHEVWRRDQGKCVRCSSVRNLEFDHIIPLSRGGSNRARNLQLLCESCNRLKSDDI